MVVFFLPALVVYTVIMDSGIGLLLRGILLVLMIPLLSVGLSYILNWLFFLSLIHIYASAYSARAE